MKSENPVIKNLMEHRSIRRYKEQALPEGLLEKLIECGLRSSSSGNMQNWSVVATTDKAIKEKLYVAHHEQDMIMQAPYVLTFCSDMRRTGHWLKLSGAKSSFDDLTGFLMGAFDAVIASQSICAAAESEGLGICYMGTTVWHPDQISDALSLPKHVIPVTSIVLGYPDETPALRDRLPLESVLHFETYQDKSDSEIKQIYKEREVNGWKRYMSTEKFLKIVKDAGIENLGQYYTSDLKYGKKIFAETSVRFLQAMKDKGYWNF